MIKIKSDKKILFVIPYLAKGGAEKILSNITIHFPGEWEIDILVNDDQVIDYPFKGNIITLGVTEKPKLNSVLFQFRVFLKRIRKLRKLKKEGNYQACVSFLDSTNVASILTGNKYCKNIINIVNNMSASEKNEWIYRYIVSPLIKLFYNKADKIVAVSEDVKTDMVRNFGIKPEKIMAIYCSVDMNSISQKIMQEIPEGEKEWFSKERTVITAGRLEKQKGQWHLIRAFNKVIQYIPDARLVIFGEGPMEKYLKELVKGYQLEDQVLFHGFSQNLDMYISKSAVFAFPSLYEGLSVALLEALACALPCIAADGASGAREQLAPDYTGVIQGYYKGEYGILVEESSEEMPDVKVPLDRCENGLAEAMIEVLTSESLRMHYSEKARERSRAYDVELISRQWVEVVEK